MSRKIKKIKKKIENIHCKSFDEVLQVSAILKCLECACYYCDDTFKISDAKLVLNVIQQKMKIIENCIDDLSLI
jgi:hypothetical protein